MDIGNRLMEWRTARLALSATVGAAALAAAGIAADEGDAARAPTAHQASQSHVDADFKRPKLSHGVLRVKGTRADDEITLRLRAGDPETLEVDVGSDGSSDFRFRRDEIATIAVDARMGDDRVRIDDGNGAFTDSIPTTLDGGGGDDSIAGGRGVETLLGGDGNDSLDGNGGNDVAFMGPGDDTFVWDPGDGSDVVEGQDGFDTMLFNGAGAAEQVDLSANGRRLRFFRNPGAITMDTAGVEQVDFAALGGADVVTVNDLSGTDVTGVDVDLAGALGGSAGDGQADRVVVIGTNGGDTVTVNGDAGRVKASGLAATVGVLHAESANDRLELNTLEGDDTIDSGGLAAGSIQLLVNGVLVP